MNKKLITADDAMISFIIFACFNIGISLLMQYYNINNYLIGALIFIELSIYITLHKAFFKIKD